MRDDRAPSAVPPRVLRISGLDRVLVVAPAAGAHPPAPADGRAVSP